jgi:hypothetical protein
MARAFADLVDELLADVRGAVAADLELEAQSFAMAMLWASETPREDAERVVDTLAGVGEPEAAAILRAWTLMGPPVLRERAGEFTTSRDGVAGDVGEFTVESAWRATGPAMVADVVWFARPGGRAQSFFLASAPDHFGAALLGGGMSADADPGELEERLGRLSGALEIGAFEPVEVASVVDRMRRGSATNRALFADVSVALAMGFDIAAYALTGDIDAIEGPGWDDDGEDDDQRANFLMRVLLRATEDGVDATDPGALAAWREAFQDLSPREQLKALGLPAIGSVDDPPPKARTDAKRKAKRKQARKARKRNR